MHMSDALLSPALGLTMCAAGAAALAYAAKQVKDDELCEEKIPLMAVSGAFVFAAQMINFTIPATGSSGHIGGGILLAALLGPYPALLTLAAVLIIQCLFFADGGLLALGCNIFNLGVIPCLLVYPLLFRPLLRKTRNAKRLSLAATVAVVLGLELGAFAVVLETVASGVSQLPLLPFAGLMLPIHLAIGLAEGLVTAAVLVYVWQSRPEIISSALDGGRLSQAGSRASWRKTVAVLGLAALVIGGGLSALASSYPDGLEWSIAGLLGQGELAASPALEGAARVQEATALMPDYALAGGEGGSSLAGVLGGALTFALAGLSGWLISRRHRRQPQA